MICAASLIDCSGRTTRTSEVIASLTFMIAPFAHGVDAHSGKQYQVPRLPRGDRHGTD
jgi:hypothetical protein